MDELTQQVKQTKIWKSPGIDGVQNYWLKYFTNLWLLFTEVINKMMDLPEDIPKWRTKRKTTLIFKSGEENQAKNY